MFTLSSIPHVNMALRCIPTPFSSTAYAAESPSRRTDTHTETAQGQTPYKPPAASDKPKDPEKPGKDKDPDGKSGGGEIMTMSSAGGADSAAGISLPGLDALLFTGAATVKIPIEVPPGRAGIAPNLAFLYNSYRGNGPLGVGWDIDMGAIQRSTKRGVNYFSNEYVTVINGSSSELISRSEWGANHYGAKIEGPLSRYYYDSSTGGWVVTTKDGTKYYYGTSSASRQDFSGGYVFKWCLDKVQDTNGNYMTVTYLKDQGQIYPYTIAYTGHSTVNPTHLVVFNWASGRSDVSPMYSTNFLVKTAYQLTGVDVYGNWTLQRRYQTQYTYSTSSSRLLLTSVTQYGKDGTSLPPTSFT